MSFDNLGNDLDIFPKYDPIADEIEKKPFVQEFNTVVTEVLTRVRDMYFVGSIVTEYTHSAWFILPVLTDVVEESDSDWLIPPASVDIVERRKMHRRGQIAVLMCLDDEKKPYFYVRNKTWGIFDMCGCTYEELLKAVQWIAELRHK